MLKVTQLYTATTVMMGTVLRRVGAEAGIDKHAYKNKIMPQIMYMSFEKKEGTQAGPMACFSRFGSTLQP